MSNYIVLESIEQWNSISKNSSFSKIVIMMTGSFCQPCKLIKPKIKKLSEEFKDVLFLIVDVEQFQQITDYFSVSSMPTFIIIKNNKVVGNIVGSDLLAIRHGLMS